MHVAVIYSLDTATILLDQPLIKVNALDDDKDTPLHKAFITHLSEKNFRIIKKLFKKKADVKAQNNNKDTPLERISFICLLVLRSIRTLLKYYMNSYVQAQTLMFSIIITMHFIMLPNPIIQKH